MNLDLFQQAHYKNRSLHKNFKVSSNRIFPGEREYVVNAKESFLSPVWMHRYVDRHISILFTYGVCSDRVIGGTKRCLSL